MTKKANMLIDSIILMMLVGAYRLRLSYTIMYMPAITTVISYSNLYKVNLLNIFLTGLG